MTHGTTDMIVARPELASRRLDQHGKWVGFEHTAQIAAKGA